MNLIQQLEKEQYDKLAANKDIPDFGPGRFRGGLAGVPTRATCAAHRSGRRVRVSPSAAARRQAATLA